MSLINPSDATLSVPVRINQNSFPDMTHPFSLEHCLPSKVRKPKRKLTVDDRQNVFFEKLLFPLLLDRTINATIDTLMCAAATKKVVLPIAMARSE
jgi:hypothetical protein